MAALSTLGGCRQQGGGGCLLFSQRVHMPPAGVPGRWKAAATAASFVCRYMSPRAKAAAGEVTPRLTRSPSSTTCRQAGRQAGGRAGGQAGRQAGGRVGSKQTNTVDTQTEQTSAPGIWERNNRQAIHALATATHLAAALSGSQLLRHAAHCAGGAAVARQGPMPLLRLPHCRVKPCRQAMARSGAWSAAALGGSASCSSCSR